MRGKLIMHSPPSRQRRITPADAGKTFRTQEHCEFRWDHPRGCGENRQQSVSAARPQGSPPRMRGKPSRVLQTSSLIGITPADAGKTGCSCPASLQSGDHPRGCGENGGHVATVRDGVGSPPRMRGKRLEGQVFISRKGITPADAGKTLLTDRYADEH